ncbi:hypothetical protein CE665_19925 [Salmonella enterica subsp. enterica serovar Poona]|nr:hypothetical protein [Salmonella enterica]ECN6755357.1 hypothetical protein [Salmonella enterica subsp. enterica serovar Newport]ECV5893730.1 hypothetical protein [Salmonella enterica subsp. enterica serovar Oranienburg]EDJ2552655.1 hypothetical protein [Salmonella enterica subsp. enterica serovar Stanley]EDJ2556614.1 hypothetical protein [Salmonella enterica subsp. enterica serovar Poona]EDQ2390850.1 hypothetical protein [Salmonella enterica subsp. enterica]
MNLNMYSEIKAMLADAISLRDEQKLAEVKIALLDKITRAQEQYVDLYEKYMQLLQEKSVLESEVNEISQYELHLLSKKAGFWAYRFITDDEEKLHYLCQTCWDSTHKKQVLRINDVGFCECPACGHDKGGYLNGRPDIPVRSGHPRVMTDILKKY